jgi:hypothetical protein
MYPMNLVKQCRYIDISGDTKAAIDNRIAKGKWRRGQHYVVADKRRWINLIEVEQWLIQHP